MIVVFTDFDGCLNSAGSAELYYAFTKHDDPAMNRFYNNSDLIKFKADLGSDCRASEFCPLAVSNYNYILRKVPDLKVVVSSFWRWGKTVDELKDIFTWLGLPADRIIDKTPIIHGVQRGVEIAKWLEEHPDVTKYAIMDDDGDMDGTDEKSFFMCDSYNGLTYTQAIQIINHFNGEPSEKVQV